MIEKRKSNTDVVILGGGPAGMFASTMFGMVGLTSTILECGDRLGGQCIKVYPEKYIFDVPGHYRILAKDLVHELEKQMSRFDPQVHLNTEVLKLEKIENGLLLHTAPEEIETKIAVVANGNGTIKPVKPILNNIVQLEDKNYICYSMTDMQRFNGKDVLVGGGGDSALDWCLALHEAGASKIYLVHRRNKLRGTDSLQKDVSMLPNCNILLSREMDQVNIADNRLSFSLRVGEDKENVLVDYFVPCYGVTGDKNFLENLDFPLKLDHNYKIVVEPTTSESSCPRLYSVGDSSVYQNKRNLISVGFAEAVNAAHHARENYFSDKPFILQYSTSRFI